MKLTKKRVTLLTISVTVIFLLLLFLALFTKPLILYWVKPVYKYEIWSIFGETCYPVETDESAPKTASVTFLGATYTGEYDSTSISVPYTFRIHEYDGQEVSFKVNAETGELVSISLNREVYEEVDEFDEAFCREKADAVADYYIDLSEYKVSSEYHEAVINGMYTFEYFREMNGLKTADGLHIVVDAADGKVTFVKFYMLGSFSDVLYAKKPNDDRIRNKLDVAVLDLYSSANENSRVEYEYIDEVMLIKTPKGQTAYLYYVNTYFYPDKNSDHYMHPTQMHYIVF